jgi:hypothetical protein
MALYLGDKKVKLHLNGVTYRLNLHTTKPSVSERALKSSDGYLLKDFIDYITRNSESLTRTTIDDSIESHVMGFKAEESRKNGGISVDL